MREFWTSAGFGDSFGDSFRDSFGDSFGDGFRGCSGAITSCNEDARIRGFEDWRIRGCEGSRIRGFDQGAQPAQVLTEAPAQVGSGFDPGSGRGRLRFRPRLRPSAAQVWTQVRRLRFRPRFRPRSAQVSTQVPAQVSTEAPAQVGSGFNPCDSRI